MKQVWKKLLVTVMASAMIISAMKTTNTVMAEDDESITLESATLELDETEFETEDDISFNGTVTIDYTDGTSQEYPLVNGSYTEADEYGNTALYISIYCWHNYMYSTDKGIYRIYTAVAEVSDETNTIYSDNEVSITVIDSSVELKEISIDESIEDEVTGEKGETDVWYSFTPDTTGKYYIAPSIEGYEGVSCSVFFVEDNDVVQIAPNTVESTGEDETYEDTGYYVYSLDKGVTYYFSLSVDDYYASGSFDVSFMVGFVEATETDSDSDSDDESDTTENTDTDDTTDVTDKTVDYDEDAWGTYIYANCDSDEDMILAYLKWYGYDQDGAVSEVISVGTISGTGVYVSPEDEEGWWTQISVGTDTNLVKGVDYYTVYNEEVYGVWYSDGVLYIQGLYLEEDTELSLELYVASNVYTEDMILSASTNDSDTNTSTGDNATSSNGNDDSTTSVSGKTTADVATQTTVGAVVFVMLGGIFLLIRRRIF